LAHDRTARAGRTRRYALIAFAAILVVLLGGFSWMVILAPRAMDFAGGPTAALSEYHAQDPSGVPAELKDASLVERGEYLARAADARPVTPLKEARPMPAVAPSFCRSAPCTRPISLRTRKQASAITATLNFLQPFTKAWDAAIPACIRPCRSPAIPT